MADVALDKWFIGVVDTVDQAVVDVAERVSEEGEMFAHDAILSRGTGKTWKRVHYKRGIRRSGSINGREWTGDMRADLIGEADRVSNTIVFARVGWLRTFKDYYGDQDIGFEHPQTGHVEGMHLMGDLEDFLPKLAGDLIGRELRAI